MARHRRHSARDFIAADLDIMPLMNLFVVLIPMLLLSAVFVELSVLDMHLPSADDNANPPEEDLSLSVRIEESRYVVEGKRLKTQSIARGDEGAEERLKATLSDIRSQRSKEPNLTILSESETHYQDIITVMDIGREAGLGAVSLMGADLQ